MSRSLNERDAAHVWHPYTQHGLEPDPLPIASAEGAVLKTADGRELIDAISSWWAILHGHGHPRLRAAIDRQAATLDHVLFAGATHEPAVALAESLVEVTPPGLSRVFYSDNGSTAVEVALKMTYQRWVHEGQPQRSLFIALEGSYHGDTFGAMSVGDPDPFFAPFAPLLFDVRRVPPDAEKLAAVLEQESARVCAVLIEPLVQGAAGMVMHGEDFVRATRRLCDDHRVPLIADEVMTGFGRTGALFACERAGIAPDVLCLSKGLTGGVLPLAATLTTDLIYRAFVAEDRMRSFFHGHTFTAHPIGCAVSLASLELVRENDVPQRLGSIGARIERGVRHLADHPAVRDVRRTGGVVAVELEPLPRERTGYTAEIALRLRAAAIERGVLLRPLGPVIYAMPPACTSEAQSDRIAEVMAELVELADEHSRASAPS